MNRKPETSSSLSPIGYLAGTAFVVLLSRLILAPLLPDIQDQLGLTHGQAGGLFLYTSLGFACSMLLSGFVSRLITHRWTIGLSTLTIIVSLAALSWCPGLGCMRSVLVLLGAGGGLYMPSALATIAGLVGPQHRGRAIAIQEIGFNLSFISAPLVAALLLPLGGWRLVIRVVAAATAAGGGAFLLFGSGGREPGDPPRIAHIRPILSQPAFWIIGVLFALAMGAEVGVYSIIPTYLIKEEGMEQQLVNTLLSISRISGLPMIFVTGWLIDRLGIKPLLFGVLSFSGALTALLGAAHQNLLLAAVFLQPVVIICFFPAALAALTDLGSRKSVSLATSLMIPFTYLFGAGLVPALLGILGENDAFSHGFYITGGILLAGLVPLTFLPVPKPDSGTDDAGTAAPGPNAGTVAGSALSETGGAPAEPGTSTSETGDESY